MAFLIKNTVTNYAASAIRILQGILVTRWMIGFLGPESYGLWSLLWTFFAYALLLDFGFGLSAQKFTSTGLYQRDPDQYNQTMSAIFSFHLLMAVLIVAASFGASFFLPEIFRITDPEKLAYCRKCYFLFAIGTAVVFPTGMFPEMLLGIQRIYLRNYILTATRGVELIVTLAILWGGGGLAALIVTSEALALGANLAMYGCARHYLPRFHLTLKIDFRRCREVASFSGFVYINAIARLVQNKTSRLIISIFCGLEQVGIYHLASRLGDLTFQAGAQYQENVRPMVASLYAEKRYRELGGFVINSMRWNTFMGLALMLPAAVVTPEIFQALFNVNNPEVNMLARWVLLASFLNLVLRQIPYSVLLMAEKHRMLSMLMIVNAILTLGLNIALLPHFGIQAVVYNTIALVLLLTLGGLIPVMLKKLHMSFWRFWREIAFKPLLPALAGAIPALAIRYYWGASLGAWGTMLIAGGCCGGIFVVLSALWILDASERRRLAEKFHLGGR